MLRRSDMRTSLILLRLTLFDPLLNNIRTFVGRCLPEASSAIT
ncbi:hypothetical protein CfE428DRAFT_2986 [Chthoniobacter flavus Ellin428]|uniref:Uncharacterized protein n=1 Tax=Chthoniobacter flavus Ellin428 TaxID=497964 RepID=B4D261_9BACT|nr:hypothetical protein CfE428DRAFT_2986 [Chthoniobacter flavus Ellin428]